MWNISNDERTKLEIFLDTMSLPEREKLDKTQYSAGKTTAKQREQNVGEMK